MRWKEAGVAFVILLCWSLLHALFGQSQVESIVMTPISQLTEPVVQLVGSQQRPLRPLIQWWQQADQIKQLSSMLAEAESQLVQLKGVEKENEQLRALLENRHLDLRERRISQTVASYAVPSLWLGKDTTIPEGSLVLYKNILLGKVARVHAGLGAVELLPDSDSFRVVVVVDGQISGVTHGDNGQLVIENLPPDAQVQPGQQVTTLGQPGVPPGLLIGLTAGGVEYISGQGRVMVDQLVSFYETPLVEVLPL